jgi:sulfur-oxidizing protein SoxY
MDEARRIVLRRAGATGMVAAALAAGLLKPERAIAASWNKAAFDSKSAVDALQNMGAANPQNTGDIVIEAPEIAENGAVVPIEISSKIPDTTSLAVLVEKNPQPLAGQFQFMAGALPYVKVNVKMAESSVVRVVAQAGGKSYTATKEIKVTAGGCGG